MTRVNGSFRREAGLVGMRCRQEGQRDGREQ